MSDLDPFPCPGVLPLNVVASDGCPAICTWRFPLDGDVVLVTVCDLRLAGTTRLVIEQPRRNLFLPRLQYWEDLSDGYFESQSV